VKLQCLFVPAVLFLTSAGVAQTDDPSIPFTLTWTEGICLHCKTATALCRIQFVSREEAWAIGSVYGEQGGGDFILVHTKDAGRTWRELPQSEEYAGDPDGPPAFWFLDSKRGWFAKSDEPMLMRTSDGGKTWQKIDPPKYSQESLQRIVYFDENHAYGTSGTTFFRTSDGGRNWSKTNIPHLLFIDRILFLTPQTGWITGTDGQDFLVFRTTNGGHDWEESRTLPPRSPSEVRDLSFLDQSRGWLITWPYNDDGTYLSSTADGGKTWLPENDLSFQGRGNMASAVRFLSEQRGFVFLDEDGQDKLMYTTDAGAHWRGQSLPRSVYDCQVFEGDLLCSAGNSPSGFWLLTVHPR